jgi:hypothetical protein
MVIGVAAERILQTRDPFSLFIPFRQNSVPSLRTRVRGGSLTVDRTPVFTAGLNALSFDHGLGLIKPI